jgi:quinol monooxygenase YgiN
MEIVILQLKTSAGRRQDVFEALQYIQGQVQVKPDCLQCGIFRAVDDQAAFLYIERWKTKAALQYHIQSLLYKQLLSIMELAITPPEIDFYHVSSSESIDLITRLRREC